MKKILKISLIFLICFIFIFGIKIAVSFWMWHNISSQDQLKVAQSAYDKCVAEGGNDCDYLFTQGLKTSLQTREKEDMAIVLDKTKSAQERIDALEHFYLYADDSYGDIINKERMDFYYLIVMDEENPLNLSQQALEYLLSHPSEDKKILKIQRQVALDKEYDVSFRKSAVMSLAKIGYEEDKNIFYQMLIEKDSPVRFWAHQGLINIEAVDKIPDLLRVALNENEGVSIRSQAMSTMNDLILQAGAVKDLSIVEELEPLLDHQSVGIWTAANDLLETLTGKKYKEDNLTEEEMDEYVSNLLENFSIEGIDY